MFTSPLTRLTCQFTFATAYDDAHPSTTFTPGTSCSDVIGFPLSLCLAILPLSEHRVSLSPDIHHGSVIIFRRFLRSP
jgi:hypothetical protein